MLDGKVIPVTSHEDLTDQGQTIKLVEEETPKTPETPETPETPTTNPTADRGHYEPGFVGSHSASDSRRNRMWHLEDPQEKEDGG